MSTSNAHATLRGENVDEGESVSMLAGENKEGKQSFPKITAKCITHNAHRLDDHPPRRT